jgi:hypothetical protein
MYDLLNSSAFVINAVILELNENPKAIIHLIQKKICFYFKWISMTSFDQMELHLIINGKVENNWQLQFHLRNFKWITSIDIH